ncbi:hypothetical protein SS50377_22899 [Spironucleus salmonicida]|uniref:Uncharacterized protein n=1 Tax=Spironucleus salmonicida TaxID=348837 RepID=A0A9P8S046_9EUKA|nr:hypothetical protein SS50377_22899 [Spironucleus salmonicida]
MNENVIIRGKIENKIEFMEQINRPFMPKSQLRPRQILIDLNTNQLPKLLKSPSKYVQSKNAFQPILFSQLTHQPSRSHQRLQEIKKETLLAVTRQYSQNK